MGRAEAQHFVDDVRWLERGTHLGKFQRHFRAQLFLQLGDVDLAPRFERDHEDRFLRPARPLIHSIDRVAGGDRADVTDGDFNFVRADEFVDERERLLRVFPGAIDVRAIGAAQPHAELALLGAWEKCRA